MSTVIPKMSAGGNITVLTEADGTDWASFASTAAKQLTISNNTGEALEFRQGGAGAAFPIFNATYYTIYGLANAADIQVRRVVQENDQLTVTARWEA